MPGFVYILTNPSFKEDWVKIGKSSRPVDIRSKELDNTAVPLPFNIYATLETEKYSEVEKLIHKTIDRLSDLRIRQNREFFNICPEVAFDILTDIAKTLDDGKVRKWEIAETQEVTDEEEVEKKRLPPFKFSYVGIKIGEELEFIEGGIKVKVASDNEIEYKGRLWHLSPFVATYLPEEKRIPSGAYQGPKWFKYNGKLLTELR